MKPDNLLSLTLHPALTAGDAWGQVCALLPDRLQRKYRRAPGKYRKAVGAVGNKANLKDKYRPS